MTVARGRAAMGLAPPARPWQPRGTEILDRRVVTELVIEAKVARGLTWTALAEALDVPLVWSTAALLGQHPLSAEQAGRAVEVLGLPAETAAHLQRVPVRGPRTPAITADPTVYRLQEAVNVYGETIKELVHEEFGDGIMSAIPPRHRPRPPPRRGPRGHHPGRKVPALRLGVRSRQRPTTT